MPREKGVTLLSEVRWTRISVNDWRRLNEEERSKYEFVSDPEGYCFKLIEEKEEQPTEDTTDDFEKIMKGRERNG